VGRTYASRVATLSKLQRIIETLLKTHRGAAPFPSRDPWELILRENVAYLVDDATRESVFRSLERSVGLTPEAILGVRPEDLVDAIRDGGMRPLARAGKLQDAAGIALEIGLARLRAAAREGGPAARKILKRFPGIAEPGADKLLMAAGGAVTIAPESNGLRVLVRRGMRKRTPTTRGCTVRRPRRPNPICAATPAGSSERTSSFGITGRARAAAQSLAVTAARSQGSALSPRARIHPHVAEETAPATRRPVETS
jgi:hypothetical protein